MSSLKLIVKNIFYQHKFKILNFIVLFIFVLGLYLFEYFTNIKIDITILVAILGFAGVIMQMNSAKNVSSAGYDLEMQNSFVNNHGFNELFLYCWNKYIGVPYKNYKRIEDIDDYQTVLFSYFTFFESIYLMYRKGVVKMNLIDDLFGRRFFVVVNCKEIQDLDLKKNKGYYENIFKLYREWGTYRLAHNNRKLTVELENNEEFATLENLINS